MNIKPYGGGPASQNKREDDLVAQIRTNIVFEKLIVSVLTVAGFSGFALFAINVGVRIVSGRITIGNVGSAVYDGIAFACVFFLAGFAVSAAIGIPLFRFLENRKQRVGWPFVVSAFFAGLALLAALGRAPSFEAPLRLLFLVPPVAAAMLFVRKMRPFWQAVEHDETKPPANIYRIH